MPKSDRDALGDLISTSEVAELAGVRPSTVNRWAKSGRLPAAVKIPKQTGANLFRRADVEAFLASVAA